MFNSSSPQPSQQQKRNLQALGTTVPTTTVSPNAVNPQTIAIGNATDVKTSQQQKVIQVGKGTVGGQASQFKNKSTILVPLTADSQNNSDTTRQQALLSDSSPQILTNAGSVQSSIPVIADVVDVDPNTISTPTLPGARPQQTALLQVSKTPQTVATLAGNVVNPLSIVSVPVYVPLITQAKDLTGDEYVLVLSNELLPGTTVLARPDDVKNINKKFQTMTDRYVSQGVKSSMNQDAILTLISNVDGKACVGIKAAALPPNTPIVPVQTTTLPVRQGTLQAAATLQKTVDTLQNNDYVLALASEVNSGTTVRVQAKDIQDKNTQIVEKNSVLVTISASSITQQQLKRLNKVQTQQQRLKRQSAAV